MKHKRFVWDLTNDGLPRPGRIFVTEEDDRQYYWQPCTCCGLTRIIRASDHRLDVAYTFLARGMDQGEHIKDLALKLYQAVKEEHEDLDFLLKFALLYNQGGAQILSPWWTFEYMPRFTMSEVYPYLGWPYAKMH